MKIPGIKVALFWAILLMILWQTGINPRDIPLGLLTLIITVAVCVSVGVSKSLINVVPKEERIPFLAYLSLHKISLVVYGAVVSLVAYVVVHWNITPLYGFSRFLAVIIGASIILVIFAFEWRYSYAETHYYKQILEIQEEMRTNPERFEQLTFAEEVKSILKNRWTWQLMPIFLAATILPLIVFKITWRSLGILVVVWAFLLMLLIAIVRSHYGFFYKYKRSRAWSSTSSGSLSSNGRGLGLGGFSAGGGASRSFGGRSGSSSSVRSGRGGGGRSSGGGSSRKFR